MPETLLDTLRAARVVPVVRTHETRHAATAVQWLRDAGLRIFEITMTIPDAPSLIRELARDPGLLVGAGTVPNAAMAETCLNAGARFIVAPWIDPSLAAPCRAAKATLMLGALTPTEVRTALSAGADVVKIFPASSVGGPAHIRALRSVLPDVYPTNICFGGPDLRTAYITLSASGQLAAMQWPEPGLKLNFMA